MNTENTRDEDLIDLGTFDRETKGLPITGNPDSPVAPTCYPHAGLADD